MKIKTLIILSALIVFTKNMVSQVDTSSIWTYQFEGRAWSDWDSIYRIWMKNVYYPCLKENNLKMSCKNCAYIYIDALLEIDSSGKLINIQIIKENICSKISNQKLRNCFFNFFYEMVFPESLRSKKIKSKLGTGLKC